MSSLVSVQIVMFVVTPLASTTECNTCTLSPDLELELLRNLSNNTPQLALFTMLKGSTPQVWLEHKIDGNDVAHDSHVWWISFFEQELDQFNY